MTPEDVAKLLGDTESRWTPDVSTGIFESFKSYDRVWFYQTPYPTEVTIRPDGGENVEMKGAWLAFRNGNLVYCSGCAPS